MLHAYNTAIQTACKEKVNGNITRSPPPPPKKNTHTDVVHRCVIYYSGLSDQIQGRSLETLKEGTPNSCLYRITYKIDIDKRTVF